MLKADGRQSWKCLGVVTLFAWSVLLPAAALANKGGALKVGAGDVSPQEVDAAVKKAVEFLYSKRNAQGVWDPPPAPPGKPHDRNWGGMTAICTYALLAAGESPQDEKIQKAIKFLGEAEITGFYAIGLRAQVWANIPHPSEEIKRYAKRDKDLFLKGIKTKGTTIGLYSYIMEEGGHVDHSVSQYGVLGMWACAQLELEVPIRYWQLVDQAWRRDQGDDGSWAYQGRPQPGKGGTASMTAAGVATLFITQDMLNLSRGECNGNLRDSAIEKGLQWMSKNFAQIAQGHSIYYNLYGVERIGVASGYKYFGTVDWYQDGAAYLVNAQSKEGAWPQGIGGPLPNTSFGILFLVRGRAPVIMNKLEYEIDAAGDRAKLANWNQRPRDLANLSHWISDETEKYLNWQIVNLRVSIDDLHDSQILYIAGNQTLNFGKANDAKLKEYLEQGGTILANADCASREFAESIRKLGQKLFPLYEFRELPAEHPIYTRQQYRREKWKVPPRVQALGNGARELILLIPQADPAKAWQTQQVAGKEELHQLAGNIFLYSVDKQNLRNKGETYIVRKDPKVKADKPLKLARIEYSGNWDPEPGGWRRMAAIMHNRHKVNLEVEPVKPGDGKLAGCKIAHLTGTTAFKLSDAQQGEIKRFIDGGGMLILDAAGGSAEFAASAQQLIVALAPEARGAAGQIPMLRMDHRLYQAGEQIAEAAYRQFARRTIGNVRMPRLRGVEMGGRLAIVFSEEDLSAGLVGQPVDGIVGYEPRSATALMTNLLMLGGGFGPPPATATAPSSAPAPSIAPATAPVAGK